MKSLVELEGLSVDEIEIYFWSVCIGYKFWLFNDLGRVGIIIGLEFLFDNWFLVKKDGFVNRVIEELFVENLR